MNYKKYVITVFIIMLLSGQLLASENQVEAIPANSETHETEQFQKKKLFYLYGIGALQYNEDIANYLSGLRITYFLRDAEKKFNIGLGFQFSYLSANAGEDLGYKTFSWCEQKYISTELLVSIKVFGISKMHNMNFGLGFSLIYRIKGDNYFYYTKYGENSFKEFNNIIPVIPIELGYQFNTKNQRFTFFVGLNYRIILKSFYGHYISGAKQSYLKMSMGVNFGIGFNLL